MANTSSLNVEGLRDFYMQAQDVPNETVEFIGTTASTLGFSDSTPINYGPPELIDPTEPQEQGNMTAREAERRVDAEEAMDRMRYQVFNLGRYRIFQENNKPKRNFKNAEEANKFYLSLL